MSVRHSHGAKGIDGTEQIRLGNISTICRVCDRVLSGLLPAYPIQSFENPTKIFAGKLAQFLKVPRQVAIVAPTDGVFRSASDSH